MTERRPSGDRSMVTDSFNWTIQEGRKVWYNCSIVQEANADVYIIDFVEGMKWLFGAGRHEEPSAVQVLAM